MEGYGGKFIYWVSVEVKSLGIVGGGGDGDKISKGYMLYHAVLNFWMQILTPKKIYMPGT